MDKLFAGRPSTPVSIKYEASSNILIATETANLQTETPTPVRIESPLPGLINTIKAANPIKPPIKTVGEKEYVELISKEETTRKSETSSEIKSKIKISKEETVESKIKSEKNTTSDFKSEQEGKSAISKEDEELQNIEESRIKDSTKRSSVVSESKATEVKEQQNKEEINMSSKLLNVGGSLDPNRPLTPLPPMAPIIQRVMIEELEPYNPEMGIRGFSSLLVHSPVPFSENEMAEDQCNINSKQRQSYMGENLKNKEEVCSNVARQVEVEQSSMIKSQKSSENTIQLNSENIRKNSLTTRKKDSSGNIEELSAMAKSSQVSENTSGETKLSESSFTKYTEGGKITTTMSLVMKEAEELEMSVQGLDQAQMIQQKSSDEEVRGLYERKPQQFQTLDMNQQYMENTMMQEQEYYSNERPYEKQPVRNLISTFEQSARPIMRYKQVQDQLPVSNGIKNGYQNGFQPVIQPEMINQPQPQAASEQSYSSQFASYSQQPFKPVSQPISVYQPTQIIQPQYVPAFQQSQMLQQSQMSKQTQNTQEYLESKQLIQKQQYSSQSQFTPITQPQPVQQHPQVQQLQYQQPVVDPNYYVANTKVESRVFYDPSTTMQTTQTQQSNYSMSQQNMSLDSQTMQSSSRSQVQKSGTVKQQPPATCEWINFYLRFSNKAC